MTHLLMSLANSYITSRIYNLFRSSGGPREEPKPLDLFTMDINTELFEGKYFAQYKVEPLNEPYVLSYFKDFNMMGLYFQKISERLPDSRRKYDPNVLIIEYERHYNSFKSNKTPSYTSPLLFDSFNKVGLRALRILKDHAERSTHSNSKHLACAMTSFEIFLGKIGKENGAGESWMPISKLAFDLINYLYFIQERYGFGTESQIIKILGVMSAVEINSQSILVKKLLERKKLDFGSRADFDVYFHAALAIEEISTSLMRDLESRFSNKYVNDLPLVHICNRFQCLMSILYTVADLSHSIEQSTEIKIRSTFLANLTSMFIHVLLSYFDLRHSMTSMIYHVTMAHSKSLEFLHAAYRAFGLIAKAVQSSVFAATNHHNFDETVLEYPAEVYSLAREHFHNPVVEYSCKLFVHAVISHMPFSESLALISDFSGVFSTLLGRRTEQADFNGRLADFAAKNLEQPFPQDKPIFVHFAESYIRDIMENAKSSVPHLVCISAAMKLSEEYVRVFKPDELLYRIDLGKIFSHAKGTQKECSDKALKEEQQKSHSNVDCLRFYSTLLMGLAAMLAAMNSFALYTLYSRRIDNKIRGASDV